MKPRKAVEKWQEQVHAEFRDAPMNAATLRAVAQRVTDMLKLREDAEAGLVEVKPRWDRRDGHLVIDLCCAAGGQAAKRLRMAGVPNAE